MKVVLAFICLCLASTLSAAQPIEGLWAGTGTRGGEQRALTVQFIRGNDGARANYWIPELGLEQMPLGVVSANDQGAITAGHAFQATLKNGRMTGTLRPAMLHGPPVEVTLTAGPGPLPDPGTKEVEVSFTSRGNLLKGTLVAPREPGQHAGIVSLHGSGPSTRWLALSRARRFARAGYAMLIFDKPGNGESKGDWTMTSLDEMAEDAINAMEFLRRRPEIESKRVGLWGHSQAGWIISRAAAMTDNISFAIVLAGGGSTSRDIEDYGYLGRLRNAGASKASTDKAMAWVRSYYDYVRTGEGYDALVGRLKTEQGEEWAKALRISTVYPTLKQQPKWRWVPTYDPASDIRRMKMPILLLFPEKDENGPSGQSLALWRQGLRAAGNRKVEWKVFADAEHHFLVPAHTEGWPRLAPGYYETQIDWLNRRVRR